MGFRNHRGYNTESRATAATKGPEEVCIHGVGSSHEPTVRGNDFVGEDLVCGHTVHVSGFR